MQAGHHLAPAAFDAARLTAVLRASGALPAGRVTDVATAPVGVGMIGESLRFSLRYDRDGPGPASLVGKFASPDATSRATGVEMNLYLREVRFYQELAATVGIATPHCHFADIDTATGDFAIIMDDLAPARAGDQLTGCALADAELAMAEAAALHGPRWNDRALHGLAYLTGQDDAAARVRAAFPACLAEFHRRYDGVLEADYMAVCDRYVATLDRAAAPWPGPFTLTHADFRLDNMLFDANGGARPLVVHDWQTIAIGPGALDVAYFIGLALPLDMRRRHERHLLERYLDALRSRGVGDYGFDALYRDYRLTMLHGVATAVFAAAVTKRTPRGDAMYLAMARGACAQAIDSDAFGALTGD